MAQGIKILYEGGVGELEEKKSRFIATTLPISSQEEALEFIEAGLVSVNHMPTYNCSMQLKLNDLLSVRHKGRVTVSNIGGTTKSNRIILELSYQV